MLFDESQLLIISGPVGVGKTTVGEELSAILEDEEISHTFVDLDGLSKTYPRSSADRFGEQIALKNLQAVWANALEVGARNLIVARVIETATGAQLIADTVGAKHYVIVQLNASDESLLNRVQRREIGSGRAWHERRAIELSRQFRDLKIADIEIDTDNESIASVAREIREHLNWARA